MIYGINAYDDPPPVVPPADGIFDFVLGQYSYGGLPLTAGDVVADTTAIIDGVGLWVNRSGIVAADDLASVLQSGEFTVVVHFVQPSILGQPTLIRITKVANVTEFITLYVNASDQLEYSDGHVGQSDRVITHTLATLAMGSHCVAASRKGDGSLLEMSVDGLPNVTAGGGAELTAGLDHSTLGSTSMGGGICCIRKVEIYATAQDSTMLQPMALNNDPISAPVNDNFADAASIAVGETKVQLDVLGTLEAGEPSVGYGLSVWFKYDALADATRTVDVTGSDHDVGAFVYTGATVDALTPVASGDSTGTFTFSATTGVTYWIACTADVDYSGMLKLALT